MSNWLNGHTGIIAVPQTRILNTVFRFVEECKRFRNLQGNLPLLHQMIRRLVFDYYANLVSYSYSRKLLVEKENLELIAFPDERYCDYLKCILEVFPDIRLLFMIRDPVTTIWSMRQRKFGYSLTSGEVKTYSVEGCIAIWNACADVIEKFRWLENAYVCQFERLVSDPNAESRRILKFLRVPERPPFFLPQPTKDVCFTAAEKELILDLTSHYRQSLYGLKQDDK